jgi:DNA-binding NtrC family response regulator
MLFTVGSDDALLEGLAQALTSRGLRVATFRTLEEATEGARTDTPLLIIVESALLDGHDAAWMDQAALAVGGALVTFHSRDGDRAPTGLPPGIARLHLAHLELPLERARLIALAEHVVARAQRTGRTGRPQPPESPAV